MLENSEKKQKSSSILLLNKLIFKKYKIAQQKSEGIFGQTYIVVNINTNKFYEMKVESKDSNYKILKVEAYNLYSIKGLGIPEFITFGILNNNNILIEELLGKSLLEIFKEYNYNFSIQDICLISIQLLDRLEWIHSKTLIHRDLKPENFLIGIKDKNNIIYLKDNFSEDAINQFLFMNQIKNIEYIFEKFERSIKHYLIDDHKEIKL